MDYFDDEKDGIQFGTLEKASFHNCIIYGDNDSEVLLESNAENEFNYNFDYCLMKIDTNLYNISDDTFLK